MTNTKKLDRGQLKNSLRAYFSKPANVITVVFLIILVLTVVLPLFTLLLGSFQYNTYEETIGTGAQEGELTFDHWLELLADKEYDWAKNALWRPLGRSILMALLACLIAVVFGGVVAWFITRSDLPCKKFISAVFVFPYIMPSWSIAMFWENFFGSTKIGSATGMLQLMTGICVPESWVYGLVPCAICLGLHYAPFAYILIGGILRNMDANLEEAATVLGASRFKILYRITLPIVAPALLSTVLLVFSSSISSYTVPFILNRNGSFIALSVQMRSLLNSGFTKGQGYVMAIILMMFSIAVLTLNNWFTGKRKSFTTVTGKSGQVSLVKLKKGRIPVAVIMVVVVGFFAIVPLISFALQSLLKTNADGSMSLTLEYWISAESSSGSAKNDTIGILRSSFLWGALGRSLALSLVVAIVAGTFGILIGYAVARKRSSRAATIVSNLAFLPYLIPSLSFGAVFLSVIKMDAFQFLDVSTSMKEASAVAICIIVGGIKFLPFASRTGTNAMLQLSGEIEEAALITGCSWGKRMTRILFPIQKSSFISGYLLPFISCMREYTLFILITSGFTLATNVMEYFTRNGAGQIANGINLLIVLFVILTNFLVNKLTGASIDKGIGG